MADPHLYCDSDMLARRISQEGLMLRIDDDPQAADDCIEEATALIDTYAGRVYPPDQVAKIPIIKFVCRLLALYFLCQRRNEPVTEIMEKEFKRYMELLEGIAAGEIVPLEVPRPLGGCAVSNQNYDVERWPAAGVEVARSTDLNRPEVRTYDPRGRGTFGPFRK